MGYLRPCRLEDALTALAARPVVVLAGGTDHFPSRVGHTPLEDILDITALPGLRAIERRGNGWWIGCGATWTDVIKAGLPPMFDGLVSAARQVGGAQVQNAGTVVGNACNASPAADGVACLMAMEAEVELASRDGRRSLPMADFVLGPRLTARRPDELVLGLRVPSPLPLWERPGEGIGASVRDPSPPPAPPTRGEVKSKFVKLGSRKYLVISIAMVAVVAAIEAGRIRHARIAVGACGPRAERLPELEASLVGQSLACPDVDPAHFVRLAPIDDIRAPAAYRRMAAVEITRRALRELA